MAKPPPRSARYASSTSSRSTFDWIGISAAFDARARFSHSSSRECASSKASEVASYKERCTARRASAAEASRAPEPRVEEAKLFRASRCCSTSFRSGPGGTKRTSIE